jgi:hypothetical protein
MGDGLAMKGLEKTGKSWSFFRAKSRGMMWNVEVW